MKKYTHVCGKQRETEWEVCHENEEKIAHILKVIYLDTNTTAATKTFRQKSDFVGGCDFNTELACQLKQAYIMFTRTKYEKTTPLASFFFVRSDDGYTYNNHNNNNKKKKKPRPPQRNQLNIPCLTTGQLFLHSRLHFFGLHFSLDTIAIRVFSSLPDMFKWLPNKK